MRISKIDTTRYEKSGIMEININNSYQIDFVGILIAIFLGIIAWELLNKRIYVPPSVWNVVIILLILGIILLIVFLAVVLVSLLISMKLLRWLEE